MNHTPTHLAAEELEALADQLRDREPARRIRARQELIRAGCQATPYLLDLLESPSQHVRWEAAETLLGIADPRSVPALIEALEDRDSDVRWVAGRTLSVIGLGSLGPLLTALVDRAGSIEFCAGAHHALSGLAAQLPAGQDTLQAVLAALESSTAAIMVPPAAQLALRNLQPAHSAS